ncbi:hypothetical protein BDV38DRAFT_257871 [Aspergillus pseudotamarii]|uniref:Uncharacterized protein n=1 Tax=Aspergillus pseudotamarii TaxID=132259 RepID=A0A5N6SFL9_ASPPS|nr:uncharacterized protein BDV38DRAFT_257871 [Aspergillus pseudotamarii]KAE8133518.1 hypothetical protein BDV38DRAFT_257871 [Aspergillus pseudotamarii]
MNPNTNRNFHINERISYATHVCTHVSHHRYHRMYFCLLAGKLLYVWLNVGSWTANRRD